MPLSKRERVGASFTKKYLRMEARRLRVVKTAVGILGISSGITQ
jgi:hypothetical protein